jgi:hypothetical protein
MQAAQRLGAGASVRAGCDLLDRAGAKLVWPKTPGERQIEKKATPTRERFFITTFFAVFTSGLVSPTQCNSRLADRYVG